MSATVQLQAHYDVGKVDSFDAVVKACGLGDEGCIDGNWLFLGTSGVHGTYGVPSDQDFFVGDEGEPRESAHLTVLVVRPRTVCMLYGQIEVTREQGAILEAWSKKCAAHIAEVHG